MSDVIIRYAKKEEIPRINELFIQMLNYVNEQNKKQGIQVDETTFQNGYDEGYLDEFFVDANRFICVAELDGIVVGYLSCVGYQTEDSTSYLYLDDFCVDSNYRGKGIGSKLVESASTFACNIGLNNLKLHVDANNSGALRFYTNLGFSLIKSENGRLEMQKEILEKKYIIPLDLKLRTL